MDGLLKTTATAAYFAKQDPDFALVGEVPNEPQPLGIMYQKKDIILSNTINNILKDMLEDGGYMRIFNKWFGQNGIVGS